MISLRLSEVEYEFLREKYRTYGANNMSDMARTALQRLMDASAAPQDVALTLENLQHRVQELEWQVAQIVQTPGLRSD